MNSKDVKHKLNLFRRYPHWKSNNCIYIHIPKAAGTSLNKAIYGRTLGHYTASEIHSLFPKLFGKAFVFSFVRNPWDRVLSAYRFAKVGKTNSMGMYRPEQYQIPQFDSFERFLFEWLAKQNLEKVDFVFQPQSKFIVGKHGHLLTDYIGKVESMDVDIKYVESKLEKTINVGRENTTSDCSDYRSEYVNDDMVELVRSLYSDDISRFNYDFDKS
ncbi:sulfotransferase family 2 domain-containing protein [Halovibrio sp. HP20-50]|uniref:sulfotransferase family 2 domain-containing protein n=1 Tax=Halovibrio sp. HP20-59 TaxID=3080275 RepID=UPI00294B5C26|nr:sulfotransferase family 2 domain-containing protein [Halovibrio sp. HP20-59]MEA2120514.1 sulfotransferase family 2 domain-containing protein [Halovibrio sp. HP20-59]